MVAVGGSIGTGLLLAPPPLSSRRPRVILATSSPPSSPTPSPWLSANWQPCTPPPDLRLYGELYLNQYLGISLPRRFTGPPSLSPSEPNSSPRHLYGLLVPPGSRRNLGTGFSALLLLVNLRSVGSFGTLRVLVRHDQVRHDCGLHPGWRACFQRPRSPAIYRSRRISSRGPVGPPARSLWAIYALAASRCSPSPPANRIPQRTSPRHSPHHLPASSRLPRRHHRSGRVMPWNHTGGL